MLLTIMVGMYKLTQLIEEPTRVPDPDKSTILDHVYLSNPSKTKGSVLHLRISDHFAVLATYDYTVMYTLHVCKKSIL